VDCRYCLGTGRNLTPAEKSAIIKAAEKAEAERKARDEKAEAELQARREAEKREERERKEAEEWKREEEWRRRHEQELAKQAEEEKKHAEAEQRKAQQVAAALEAQKYVNMGITYHREGKFEDAITCYSWALEIYQYADVQEYIEMAKKKKKLKQKK
jgi:tetratricopeptide (TPR) repeat protein